MSASISDWLKGIGLEEYAGLFVDNAVDLTTLAILIFTYCLSSPRDVRRWMAAILATFFVSLAAMVAAPAPFRQRLGWAAMIGVSVFVANRNNLIWALIVTGGAVWLVTYCADVVPIRRTPPPDSQPLVDVE